MSTIIVPTDFSPVSINALHYAIGLAEKTGSDILLFNAFQIPVSLSEIPMTAIPYEDLKKISDQKLQELTDNIHHISSGNIKVESLSILGVINTELEALVKQRNPLAVVMGTKGATGVERIFLGSNTLTAIKTLTCPVIIVPPGAAYAPINKIGFAVDFKAILETIHAENIHRFCALFNAELHILNVDKDDKHFTAETTHETFTLHNMMADLQPQYHLLNGADVEKAIHEFAETNNLDLLLIVPRKHTIFEELFHRSHTAELIYHSHIPICSIHG
jgi:nucleotide-binding universal stress UspA family protein